MRIVLCLYIWLNQRDLNSGVQIIKLREKQTMEKVKNEVAQHHHAMCVHSLGSCYTSTLDDS